MTVSTMDSQVKIVNAIAALCAKSDGSTTVTTEKIMDATRAMLENDNLPDALQAGAFTLAMTLVMEANADDDHFMTILSAIVPTQG